MSAIRHQIRPGAYYDSIVLMQLQRALAELPGVEDAGVVMATEANRALLAASDLLPPEELAASPDDLVVVVRAGAGREAEAALGRVDELLERRRSGDAAGEGTYRPRSLAAAAKMLPGARWVLISVPGRHAARVAREALALGRNVFLYSDNVPLAEEVALKGEAARRGLLVMGPDCGTATVAGIGLGFANRVRRGAVGLVAASGTGLQAVASRLEDLGAGVSHALGTGGRDLSAEVGGASATTALELLAQDAATRVIVLISKPPAPEVARRLLARAREAGKPVVVLLLGAPPPARRLGPLAFAADFEDAAELAAGLAAAPPEKGIEPPAAAPPLSREARPGGHFLRGLFSGGTLAAAAMSALDPFLTPLASNLPLRPEQRLADPARSRGHTVVDLGADELTVGRLHPMMDFDLRRRRLAQEAADPETGLILLDVVLGDGAHADPAGELAPVIEEALAARRELEVVALVVGTTEDPQDLGTQVESLEAAGARAFTRPSEAFAHVLERLASPAERSTAPAVSPDALAAPLAAINVGVEVFYDSLLAQGAPAVQVDWRPPAGGDERLAALLERMRS